MQVAQTSYDEQPSCVARQGSSDCVIEQTHLELTRHEAEVATSLKTIGMKHFAMEPPSPVAASPHSRSALKQLRRSCGDEDSSSSKVLKRERSLSDESAVGVLCSLGSKAAETCPPKKRHCQQRPKMTAPDSPTSLVERCALFTTELKKVHPPGSAVFVMYAHFVSTRFENKKTILKLVELLKPNPYLLKLFYGLLPAWCFKSPAKAQQDLPAAAPQLVDR